MSKERLLVQVLVDPAYGKLQAFDFYRECRLSALTDIVLVRPSADFRPFHHEFLTPQEISANLLRN